MQKKTDLSKCGGEASFLDQAGGNLVGEGLALVSEDDTFSGELDEGFGG